MTTAFPTSPLTRFPITRSLQWWERAQARIPCGTQCYSKGPTAYTKGFAPIYLQSGDGCRVRDVDGNEFIDLGMGLWAVTLGHAHPRHMAAVTKALHHGTQLSLMHPLEVEYAEALAEALPLAEQVRFGKNGSDVTTAAVRLARTCTGREVILRSGYHGWHDWYIAQSEHPAGVPAFNRAITGNFPSNHRAAFDTLMERYDGQVAGVIMEGIQADTIDRSFLNHIRETTRAQGALLIFDEVINGYRFALGGAHDYLGVDVDLAVFGKGIANGTPLSMIAGKARYMERFDETFFSLTFGGETLGLAAGLEVLRIYQEENVIAQLATLGKRLHREAAAAIARAGLEEVVKISPHAVRTTFECTTPAGETLSPLVLKSLLQQEMLRRGILWGGWHALSLALVHDHRAQEQLITAYGEAFEALRLSLERGSVEADLIGEPITPIFKRH